jgi:hypothetical protein
MPTERDNLSSRRWLIARATFLFIVLGIAGCGGGAMPRYDLSGTVTYNGQPVPVGYMTFAPDEAAGNSGPATQADIRDGLYATRPGQGTIGGPHAVTIYGFDGKAIVEPDNPIGRPMGTPLFSGLPAKADLPRESAIYDFPLHRN